jgi:hypothetical protein
MSADAVIILLLHCWQRGLYWLRGIRSIQRAQGCFLSYLPFLYAGRLAMAGAGTHFTFIHGGIGFVLNIANQFFLRLSVVARSNGNDYFDLYKPGLPSATQTLLPHPELHLSPQLKLEVRVQRQLILLPSPQRLPISNE